MHQEGFAGGVPEIFQTKVAEVETESAYFLLFGRQLGREEGDGNKLWIELKLPFIENSPCNGKEAYIKARIMDMFSAVDSPDRLAQMEIEVLALVIEILPCEICDNGLDDDGDGFVDCEDLDCLLYAFSLRNDAPLSRSASGCPVPAQQEIDCLLEFGDFFNLGGCNDTQSALDFCNDLFLLEQMSFPPDSSEYDKLIQYIEGVRDMTCRRCFDYGEHCGFLSNWLEAFHGNPSVVTVGEIYEMALWAKGLRENILARHLLQFGHDVLRVLDIAMWEFDLAATSRLFNSVPLNARNYGMVRVIGHMNSPVSSFSTLQYAQRFGINSYDDLVRIFQDLGWSRSAKGIEFHHLIEQRFRDVPGVAQWLGSSNPNKWKCIVVKAGAAEHTPKFTLPWKQAIPRINDAPGPGGLNTATATLADVKEAARAVYQNYPEILIALGL